MWMPIWTACKLCLYKTPGMKRLRSACIPGVFFELIWGGELTPCRLCDSAEGTHIGALFAPDWTD